MNDLNIISVPVCGNSFQLVYVRAVIESNGQTPTAPLRDD